MITVAIFNIIFVFFAYLARYKGYEFCLKVSFFLIFLFLALRYNYGNDYKQYLQDFLIINNYESIDYSDISLYYEQGWLFLYRLFQSFGFFSLVAVLAAFNCFVYYRFIRKYVSPNYYWFAVFIYVFSSGFMLIHATAMRQSLAICLFLFSIDYIYKKDFIRYFICIGLASLFHTSVLILLPVYFLGIFDWKINRPLAIIFFGLYILLFQFSTMIMPTLLSLLGSNFEKYERYEGTIELGSGLGLILNSSLFALILFYACFKSNQTSLFFKIAILSYFVVPISLSLAQLARVGMYFDIAMIIALPTTVYTIKNTVFKVTILSIIVVITLFNFYIFFESDIYKNSYKTYQTIFSAPKAY
jgi:hypothetical protein